FEICDTRMTNGNKRINIKCIYEVESLSNDEKCRGGKKLVILMIMKNVENICEQKLKDIDQHAKFLCDFQQSVTQKKMIAQQNRKEANCSFKCLVFRSNI
ncbi:hypothetical protein PV325_005812, partial [Microctonus aethiopoides]